MNDYRPAWYPQNFDVPRATEFFGYDPSEKLPMDAYYYSFELTGNVAIDRILAAVARAGKRNHHTEYWADFSFEENVHDFFQWSSIDQIQNAADLAAWELNRQ